MSLKFGFLFYTLFIIALVSAHYTVESRPTDRLQRRTGQCEKNPWLPWCLPKALTKSFQNKKEHLSHSLGSISDKLFVVEDSDVPSKGVPSASDSKSIDSGSSKKVDDGGDSKSPSSNGEKEKKPAEPTKSPSSGSASSESNTKGKDKGKDKPSQDSSKDKDEPSKGDDKDENDDDDDRKDETEGDSENENDDNSASEEESKMPDPSTGRPQKPEPPARTPVSPNGNTYNPNGNFTPPSGNESSGMGRTAIIVGSVIGGIALLSTLIFCAVRRSHHLGSQRREKLYTYTRSQDMLSINDNAMNRGKNLPQSTGASSFRREPSNSPSRTGYQPVSTYNSSQSAVPIDYPSDNPFRTNMKPTLPNVTAATETSAYSGVGNGVRYVPSAVSAPLNTNAAPVSGGVRPMYVGSGAPQPVYPYYCYAPAVAANAAPKAAYSTYAASATGQQQYYGQHGAGVPQHAQVLNGTTATPSTHSSPVSVGGKSTPTSEYDVSSHYKRLPARELGHVSNQTSMANAIPYASTQEHPVRREPLD